MSPALRRSPLFDGATTRVAEALWRTGVAAKDMLTSQPFGGGFAATSLTVPPQLASNDPVTSIHRVQLNQVSPSMPVPTSATAGRAPVADPAQAARAERDQALAALLRDAAAGNARAFEAFYDATIVYAQALARRMVRPGDLQDVLADAFFQAWREAPRFDATRGTAVTWLLTLVRSRALDLLRHQRASPEVESPQDAPEVAAHLPGPEELLAGVQAGTRLHAALAELSSNERWVLGLAYYRDLSHREICAETGLPLGTVKSLILRAQTKLHEQLANP